MAHTFLRAFQIGLLLVPLTAGSVAASPRHARAQGTGGSATPSPTLPPGPVVSPTLPPGPVASPTLPPGPTYHQRFDLYKKVNGDWKATHNLVLSSPARFVISFSRHAFKNPTVKLTIVHGSAPDVLYRAVLYRVLMHQTSSPRGRLRFQATLTIKKSRALVHDSAEFIVFEGSEGVVAFSLPFTIRRRGDRNTF